MHIYNITALKKNWNTIKVQPAPPTVCTSAVATAVFVLILYLYYSLVQSCASLNIYIKQHWFALKKKNTKKPLHYFFHDTAKLSFEHRDHVACCATSQFHISGKRGQKMNGSITSLLFHAPCTGPAERSASSPWVLSDWGRQFLGTKAPGQYAM